MKRTMVRLADAVLAPGAYCAAMYLRWIRGRGFGQYRRCAGACYAAGVTPITRHYYEPYFDPTGINKDEFAAFRDLPGIDMNDRGQIEFLRELVHGSELENLAGAVSEGDSPRYSYASQTFGPLEADYYYGVIRARKPRRIVEIGSGSSTLVALEAIAANRQDDSAYACEMTCIEPFENPWLDRLPDVHVVRRQVELLDTSLFGALQADDILFVDSSHAIRPRGDVLFEYLQVLPILKPGVLVHIHDIYTPSQYPYQYLFVDGRQWNEQYLVEAFLCHNNAFEVVGALHYLLHTHRTELSVQFPVITRLPAADVGSLWLRRAR